MHNIAQCNCGVMNQLLT